MSVSVTVTLCGDSCVVSVDAGGTWGDVLHAACTEWNLDPSVCSLHLADGEEAPTDTPLHTASLDTPATLQLSRQMHAVRELRQHHGIDAPHLNQPAAARILCGVLNARPEGYMEAADLLLQLAPPDSPAFEEAGVMFDAVRTGSTPLMEMLVARGAGLESVSTSKQTLLFKAAWRGPLETIDTLLRLGSNVDAQDYEGVTPLLKAVRAGRDADVVQRLLSAGASVNTGDTKGRRPAMFAEGAVLDLLLSADADLELADLEGNTPLMLSGRRGAAYAAALLRHGANPRARNNSRGTALHLAVGSGDVEVVRLLLAAGADAWAQDEGGVTPLMQAAWLPRERLPEIISALKEGSAAAAAAAPPTLPPT